ncbi:MAG TPA: hypothetical protein DCL77_15725 [Prolixibacteraceae bacterium]|nr:hypothetical protein [Prolixibacteraceae bacterium]
MYRRFDEAVLGFSRNIHEYFGGNRVVMIVFFLIVFTGPFIVWAVLGWTYLFLFLALVVANRLFVSLACRQNILYSILLHPFQMISFAIIISYNIFRRIKKDTTWKGRKISL